MADTLYTFSTLGLEDKEVLVVNIVLKVFQENIRHIAHIATPKQLDILLISEEYLAKYNSHLPKYTIVLGQANSEIPTFTQLDRPLRTKNLLQVIEQVLTDTNTKSHLPKPVAEKIEKKEKGSAQQSNHNTASNALLDSLLTMRNGHKTPMALIVDDYSLAINFETRQFYIRAKQGELSVSQIPAILKKIAEKSSDVIVVKSVSKAVLAEEYMNYIFSRVQPLDKLIWLLANYGTKSLLPVLDQSKQFKLKYLPNVTMLNLSSMHVRLFSFLLKHLVDMNTLVEQFSLSKAQVAGILNACYILGYLEVDVPQTVTARPNKKKPVNKALIGGLRKRLGMRSAQPMMV